MRGPYNVRATTVTAQWGLVDGRLCRRVALELDGRGAVRRLVAPTGLRGQVDFGDGLLLPGAVQACLPLPPTTLPDAAAAATGAGPFWAQVLDAQPTAGKAEAMLAEALYAAVERGVTTVGIPYLGPTALGLLTAYLNAAKAVGLRLAVLDSWWLAPATRPADLPAHADLEAAMAHLERLVRALVQAGDARLSWGLLLPSPAALPLDALVSTRLRLGHFPTLLQLDGASFAPGPSPAAICADPIAAAAAAGVLDAGLTVLTAPHQPLSASQQHTLATLGTQQLILPSAQGDHGWPTLLAATANVASPTRMAAAALGLQGGRLRPGHYADFMLLRPPAGVTLPDSAEELAALLADSRQLPPGNGAARWQQERIYVAGLSLQA